MFLKTLLNRVIFLSYLSYFSLVDSEESNNRHVRNSEFETCLESFDIHQDKIIRTQDSRAIGAKYLNERDVPSRADCLKLCCETDNCDVFVFEEKSPGSCYLFECGTSENFKCKFTKHQNYTSAVLAVNRQLTELESEIKFTQHEQELTKLRDPPKIQPITDKTTTQAPKTKEVAEDLDNGSSLKKGCSKYQFECHTSKECIAIYNACDGIPQCADGSDEGPELGCPQVSTPVPVKIIQTQIPPRNDLPQEYPIERNPEPIAENIRQWPHQQYVAEGPVAPNAMSQNVLNNQISRAGYGREGEMMNYHQDPQWKGQYHQNTGQSQIFTHKGNGLVPQTDRYQHPYPQEMPKNMGYEQPDVPKYYYDNSNMPYRMFPQNQQPNQQNWQSGRRIHDGPTNPVEEVPTNRENMPVNPDYYYEESYRNRQPYNNIQQPVYTQRNPPVQAKPVNQAPEVKETEIQKDIKTTLPPTIESEKETSHAVKDSHRKLDKLSAESKVKETPYDGEIDGHSTNPSGAILSLTMGLCITAIMIVLVGCRMRVVRKRMRRGGKSSYAHDADFLVNGMYL